MASQVYYLQAYLPCLEELHLCKNCISSLKPDTTCYNSSSGGCSTSSGCSSTGQAAVAELQAAAGAAEEVAGKLQVPATMTYGPGHVRQGDQVELSSGCSISSGTKDQIGLSELQKGQSNFAVLGDGRTVPLLSGFRRLQVCGDVECWGGGM
jgi:hypothetical protein